jgi:hypothetical protein
MPIRDDDDLTARVRELEASLARAQASEREQRRRADALEASARTAWKLSTFEPRRHVGGDAPS